MLSFPKSWGEAGEDVIIQEDGAPYHSWDQNVRAWLNENFDGCWMGRMSANLPWPPWSPDLTPMDFFLWGFIKSIVYQSRLYPNLPVNMEELKARIQRVFNDLKANPEMIHRAIEAYQHRLTRCIEVEGKSVEPSYANEEIMQWAPY